MLEPGSIIFKVWHQPRDSISRNLQVSSLNMIVPFFHGRWPQVILEIKGELWRLPNENA